MPGWLSSRGISGGALLLGELDATPHGWVTMNMADQDPK